MTRKASLAVAALAAASLPLTGAAIAEGVRLDHGEDIMGLLPPDRLSVDRDSPFYDVCYKRIGVRLDGIERRSDVQEYCMSEGWIMIRQRNAVGKFRLDGEGRYQFEKLTGSVVAYFKDGRPTRKFAPSYTQPPEAAKAALSAAEAKRQRRGEKMRRDAERQANA